MEKEDREMFGASTTPRERDMMERGKEETDGRKMFGASMTPRERQVVTRMMTREKRKGKR